MDTKEILDLIAVYGDDREALGMWMEHLIDTDCNYKECGHKIEMWKKYAEESLARIKAILK